MWNNLTGLGANIITNHKLAHSLRHINHTHINLYLTTSVLTAFLKLSEFYFASRDVGMFHNKFPLLP